MHLNRYERTFRVLFAWFFLSGDTLDSYCSYSPDSTLGSLLPKMPPNQGFMITPV